MSLKSRRYRNRRTSKFIENNNLIIPKRVLWCGLITRRFSVSNYTQSNFHGIIFHIIKQNYSINFRNASKTQRNLLKTTFFYVTIHAKRINSYNFIAFITFFPFREKNIIYNIIRHRVEYICILTKALISLIKSEEKIF